jgi:hypothetical protein
LSVLILELDCWTSREVDGLLANIPNFPSACKVLSLADWKEAIWPSIASRCAERLTSYLQEVDYMPLDRQQKLDSVHFPKNVR